MDPLTALSLASAVLQIVSFIHDIAKDGSPDADLAGNVTRLSDLTKALEDELLSQQGTGSLTGRQQHLKEVAQKCLKSSKDLAEELDKVKPRLGSEGSDSKMEHLVCSQTWRENSRIEGLQKEMREVEQTMQSSILADMWLSREAASIQQEDSFKGLDDRLQRFISQRAQGNQKLPELIVTQAATIRNEVSSGNTKERGQIATQLQRQESVRSTQEQGDKLLGSLAYDAMTARKSRMIKSHENTCHWIFDDTIARPWDSFLEWLKSDDRIYWISGKPGSGKSTLMNFLVDDDRTKDALREWRPGVAILSFFLWNRGTPIQRSVQGLLSAILHQVLSMNKELIPHLLAEQPKLFGKTRHSDWSDEELESVLVKSISMSPKPLCIFLDGLDEIDRDEGYLGVVDLIERLRGNTNAKFCVSSRPEVEFKDAFRKHPKLRLQDLTAKDISNVVDDFLQKNPQFKVADGDEVGPRQKFIDTVVERASGVFLWVHIVLRKLNLGNTRVDSYEQLQRQITQIPSELEQLYMESWKQNDENEYLLRAEAARYFKLVLEVRNYPYRTVAPFSLFEFVVASNRTIQTAVLGGKSLPLAKSLVDETRRFCRRIESCCGGLLEISWHDPSPTNEESFGCYVEAATGCFLNQLITPLSAYVDAESGGVESLPQGSDLAALWKFAYHGRLDFIHRTAADFLLKTSWGRGLIDSDPTTTTDIRVGIFRSRLVHALFFTFPTHHERDNGYNISEDLSEDFLKLQCLRRSIPDELGRNLQVQFEDVYERLFNRVYTADYIITQLRIQIRNGQFGASYSKIMCDFISSYTVKSLQALCTREEMKVKSHHILTTTASRAAKEIDAIGKVCLQIVVNYESDAADLSHKVDWPAGVPKFPVLRCVVPPSDGILVCTFANMFFIIWVLLDARSYLRKESARSISWSLSRASRMGTTDTLKRCIGKRANAYARVKNFKEILLYEASQGFGPWEWRNDETICWLLEERADPIWRDGPSYRDGQGLAPFERFLLSVPSLAYLPTDTSLGRRIVATIQAYINAGANLDRVICLSREAHESSTWNEQEISKRQFPMRSSFRITIESNIRQLVHDTMSVVETYFAEQDLDIRDALESLGTGRYRGYRKVLCVSNIGSDKVQCAAASPEDSDSIFEILDSKRPSGKQETPSFKAKLQGLLEKILETGEKVQDIDRWPGERGHTFWREVGAQRKFLTEAKPLYEALFPDLAHGDDLESEGGAGAPEPIIGYHYIRGTDGEYGGEDRVDRVVCIPDVGIISRTSLDM